ncbi:DUF7706 family protein (plasmid) [Robbsia andropogonis]|uniref:DUF7706 family protein n=1 Tax=Robbsia andropogonis TaxID=28092 RepID=UPI003D1999AD
MSRFTIEIKDLDASLGNADMTEVEALALAQLCKRLTFSDMQACAVDNDEAYAIRNAVDKLQRALNGAGYAPR